MPINYLGSATAVEPPSAAPAPGAIPTAQLPADADPRNADSVRQMGKVPVDFLAHIQGAVRLEKPAQPSTTAGVGRMWSNPVHSGVGTGTVKPTVGSAFNGYRLVVKIVASGGLGVGTFALSLDGGKTYGGTLTIPGGGVYSPSDMSITFAGTFTATDTYSWRGVDTALAQWITTDSHARETIDHLGYLMGKVSMQREDWSHAVTGAFTDNVNEPFPGYARWDYTIVTGTTDNVELVDPDEGNQALGNFSSVLLTVGLDASPVVAMIRHSRYLVRFNNNSNAEFAIVFPVRLPHASAGANETVSVGLDDDGTFSTGGGGHWIRFTATLGGNWFAQVRHGAAYSLNVDTTIAPTSGPGIEYQWLRIEYYGPDSTFGTAAGGAVVRFLIDGLQVGIVVVAAGFEDSARAVCRAVSDSTGAEDSLQVGPIAWGCNWLRDPVWL